MPHLPKVASLAALVALAPLAGPGTLAAPAEPMAMAAQSTKACELQTAMRKLWEDHITYTRNYIISALGGLGDADAVAQRLMKNQEDIGDAIVPYYGRKAGTQLTTLLKAHIAIAADVVKAAKSGDKKELAQQQAKWSANGEQIADFLASANPNWPRAELARMLQRHLDLTSGEVVGRLSGDWAADIRSYDEGHAHMMHFADVLSEGIKKQFPRQF